VLPILFRTPAPAPPYRSMIETKQCKYLFTSPLRQWTHRTILFVLSVHMILPCSPFWLPGSSPPLFPFFFPGTLSLILFWAMDRPTFLFGFTSAEPGSLSWRLFSRRNGGDRFAPTWPSLLLSWSSWPDWIQRYLSEVPFSSE